MRGATTLRRAHRHLSPAVILDLSRLEVFGLLGTEPLDRFTTTVGALIDQALDDALDSTPGEIAPTGQTSARPHRRSPVPQAAIDRFAPSASMRAGRPLRPRPAPTRPTSAEVARRPFASSHATHDTFAPGIRTAAADAPRVRPLVATPLVDPLGDVAVITEKPGAAATVAANDLVAVPAPGVSPVSWIKRAAALGASTPVVVEPVATNQPPAPDLASDRQRSAARSADDHHRVVPLDAAASEPVVRRSTHDASSIGTHQPVAPSVPVGRSQLAGLAQWWNQTHGPVDPPPLDAPTLPPDMPAVGSTSTRRQPPRATSLDATGPDDLRAVFNGLLEEALLTEARADGIEVRP